VTRDPRRDLQGALHERTDLGHALQLVERPHGVGLAGGVAEVVAVVALALEIDAGREPMLQASERQLATDRGARAVRQAV